MKSQALVLPPWPPLPSGFHSWCNCHVLTWGRGLFQISIDINHRQERWNVCSVQYFRNQSHNKKESMNIRLDLRVVTVSSVTSVLPSSSPLKPAPESERNIWQFCFHPFPSIVSLTSFDGFSRVSKYLKLTWYRHLSKTDYSHLWELLGRSRHVVQNSHLGRCPVKHQPFYIKSLKNNSSQFFSTKMSSLSSLLPLLRRTKFSASLNILHLFCILSLPLGPYIFF